MDKLDEGKASRLVNLVQMCMLKICEIFYPADPLNLVRKVAERVLNKPSDSAVLQLVKNLIHCQKQLPNQSLQQDALLALLASSFTNVQLKESRVQ